MSRYCLHECHHGAASAQIRTSRISSAHPTRLTHLSKLAKQKSKSMAQPYLPLTRTHTWFSSHRMTTVPPASSHRWPRGPSPPTRISPLLLLPGRSIRPRKSNNPHGFHRGPLRSFPSPSHSASCGRTRRPFSTPDIGCMAPWPPNREVSRCSGSRPTFLVRWVVYHLPPPLIFTLVFSSRPS